MKTFVAYVDWYDYSDGMSFEEKSNLFDCIRLYTKWNDPIPLDTIKFVWNKIKKMIDADKAKRDEKSNINRENINKRWEEYNKIKKNTTVYEPIPANYVTVTVTDTVNDNITDNDNKIISSKEEEPKGSIEEYGKSDINFIIQTMKDACNEAGIQYMPWFKEREFAKHITSKKLAKEIEKYDMPLEIFVKSIIKLSAQPYMKACNTPQLFYQNWWFVLNSSKNNQNNWMKVIDLWANL